MSLGERHQEIGFTLVEVVVGMGLAALISVGVASALNMGFSASKRLDGVFALRRNLEGFHAALQSSRGWNSTINNTIRNPRLFCLIEFDPNQPTPTIPSGSTNDCADDLDSYTVQRANASTFIRTIYEPNGSGIKYDAALGPNGMNAQGEPCTIPGDVRNPNTQSTITCPVKILFWVYQYCSVPNGCRTPDVGIESIITSNVENPFGRMNFSNYEIKLTKVGSNDLGQFCQNLSGTAINSSWDPSSRTCGLTYTSTRCDRDKDGAAYVVGLTSDFQPICESEHCLPGTYVDSTVATEAGQSPVCKPVSTSAITCTDPTYPRLVGIRRDLAGNIQPVCDTKEPVGSFCPPGEAPRGVDADGNAQGCTQYHQGSDSCGANQVQVGVNPDGSVQCQAKKSINCPFDSPITDILPDGTPVCGRQVAPATVVDRCPNNLLFKGHNPDGTLICEGPIFSDNAPVKMGSDPLKTLIQECQPGRRVLSCHCWCDTNRMRRCGAWLGGQPGEGGIGSQCVVTCEGNGDPNADIAVFAICM